MTNWPQDEFARHFIQNQSRVYAYIATLLPNRSDAEEILQRTSLVMWQKWDQFDATRGFLPWARGIALNEIRNFMRRSERKNVHLSDAVLGLLATEIEQQGQNDRMSELHHCLQQLEVRQRQLVEQCYLESLGVKRVAESLGSSVDAIYMRLHRIRRSLLQCIESRLGELDQSTGEAGA